MRRTKTALEESRLKLEDERIKLEVQKLKFDSEAKMREAQAERNSAVLVAIFKLLEKGNKQNKQIRSRVTCQKESGIYYIDRYSSNEGGAIPNTNGT